MSINGICLSFPIRPDARGTLAVVYDDVAKAVQFLTDLIETRVMERVMLPGYGIRDRIFAVMRAGFVAQLAAEMEEQAEQFLPVITSLRVFTGEMKGEAFIPGFTLNQQLAALRVEFIVQGAQTPRNLTFPVWELLNGVRSI